MNIEIDIDVFLPCYHHLIDNDDDLNFLWGGRDSGKSYFIAQRLLMECLQSNYFRCILVKKTHESIKDSQWQLLKDVAEDWGVDHLFSFNSSPLTITCINGNKFIARGCDNPGKLKSISNPSHVWYEEGNQLTLQDYIVTSTTLRSNKGKVKQWFSFNPEAEDGSDYADFWLYKNYFKGHEGDWNFSATIDSTLPDGSIEQLRYTSTHTTYKDNKYVSRERIGNLESLSLIDPYYYRVFTLGEWGNVANDSPWAYAFSPEDHIGRPELNRNHEVYLSFDFNRNPACCSVIQHYNGKARVLETIKRKGGTDGLCEYILVNYPGCLFIVTGDYSGTTAASMFDEKITNYTIIQNKLGLADGQIQIMPNPRLKDNSVVVNSILAHYPVEVHETKAAGLIYDFKNVKRLADGTIDKRDREDEAQQADALDTFRYFCNKFLKEYVFIPDLK